MTRTTRRAAAWLAVLLVLVTASLMGAPRARAAYPGDLKAAQAGLVDEAGSPVTRVERGKGVRMRYTITNTLAFPVQITGVDSEAVVSGCTSAWARKTRKVDPHGVFPILLKPGEKTDVLLDETYTLAADASCPSVRVTFWKGNVLGNQVSATATPSGSASATSRPSPVATATALPTRAASTAPARPTEKPAGTDWLPYVVVGGGTLVLGALIYLLLGRRR